MRVQLNEFSQTEHTCLIGIQIKKQNMTSTLEVPPLPYAYFQSLIPKVTTILISNRIDWLCLFLKFMWMEPENMYFSLSGFFSFSMILVISIHIIACSCSLFICIAHSVPWCGNTTMYLSILNRQASGYLGSLQFGAIVNGAAMSIPVYLFWTHMNVSFRYISRNAITGSKGMHVLNFRKCWQFFKVVMW